MTQIADVRRQIANVLGYKTFADYKLAHTMAQTPENVYSLLNNLRDAYLPIQKKEMKELEKFASKLEGKKIKTVSEETGLSVFRVKRSKDKILKNIKMMLKTKYKIEGSDYFREFQD